MVSLLFTFEFSIFNRSRVSILAAETMPLSNTASVGIADGTLTVSVTARVVVEEEDIEGEGDADESPRITLVEGRGEIDVTTVAVITVSSIFGTSEEEDEEGVGDGVASDHNQANEEGRGRKVCEKFF